MAGMFDDLIPEQKAALPTPSGGMFDDLIPQKEAAPTTAPNQSVNPAYDFFASMPRGFLGGLSNTLSAGGQGAQIEMGQPVNVPSGLEMQQVLQKVTGSPPEPQGLAGRIGAAVAEPFGNPLSLLAPGAAALSGIGGQLGKETGIPGGGVVGSLLGGATPSAIGRVISPVTADAAALAAANTLKNRFGVDTTAGQATGSKALRIMENELGNAPFAGGKASEANTRTQEQITGAVLKDAGIPGNRATTQAVNQGFVDNSAKFNSIAARNPSIPIPGLDVKAKAIADDFENLTGSRSPLLDNLTKALQNPAGGLRPGNISGQSYQAVQSQIGRFAKQAEPNLKMALYDLKGELDDAVGNGLWLTNSKDAQAWARARNQYKNLLVVERALGKTTDAANQGLITPTALAQSDLGVAGKRAYVRGSSNYGDLSRAANTVLKAEPNSNTSARFFAHALPTAIGAMLGAHEGGVSLAGVLSALGGAVGPGLVGRAVMSPPMQAYLRNQAAAGMRGRLGRNLLVGGILGAGSQ